MIREMNIADIRKNFGDIVNEVRYRHDSIILHKSGKPVAALIDIEFFNKVKGLKSQSAVKGLESICITSVQQEKEISEAFCSLTSKED